MITFCKWVMKNEHFLKKFIWTWIRQIISKFNSKSWIKTVLVATSLTSFSFRAERRKYTNAPTLCRLWPSVDDDDGDYTLAPPGHIAIAIEVQWLQSTARVREKTWRFLVTSPLRLPQIFPAFRKNPIQFFAKLWIPLEVWSARKLDRIWIYARGCMNSNQSTIQYKARIRINSSRPLAALLCYHT